MFLDHKTVLDHVWHLCADKTLNFIIKTWATVYWKFTKKTTITSLQETTYGYLHK